MTIGEKIRNYRKVVGLTQKQLGALSKTSERTIQQYELGKRQPRIEQLQKIAPVLKVSVSDLLGTPEHNQYFWSSYLEDKLKQIGYRLAYDEDNAMIWIESPEGTLEVTDEELKELDDSTVSYLQFKLEELKKKHPKDFRSKKKSPAN